MKCFIKNSCCYFFFFYFYGLLVYVIIYHFFLNIVVLFMFFFYWFIVMYFRSYFVYLLVSLAVLLLFSIGEEAKYLHIKWTSWSLSTSYRKVGLRWLFFLLLFTHTNTHDLSLLSHTPRFVKYASHWILNDIAIVCTHI